MKIAFLSYYSGQVYRGAETFVHELSIHLKNYGHQVSIHKNIFDRISPDAQIVVSTNGRLDAILAKLWCLVHTAKLLISGQSGIGWDDKLNLWVFPDVFVGLTDYQCRWARRVNPFVNIVKIPNGVDLKMFNPNVKPLKISLRKPVILNVAALEPNKRQNLLLKAAVNFSVLLVGKGTGKYFTHAQMPHVYTACDLFSYPTSPAESFGIVLLEAMASGLPVVTTDDPIRREIVGDAGLFVDPTNTQAFASALNQSLMIDWGDKPRQQASKFSWDSIALKYHQLCQKIIS